MKILPYLNTLDNRSEKYVVNFRGINYSEEYNPGEFSETLNLTTERFPCISPRRERVAVAQYVSPTALHAKEGLLVIDGTNVVYGGKVVGTVTAGKKQTATIGNYVVIFPDKKYYNVVTDTFGNMEETYTATGLTFASGTITTTAANWPFKVGDAVEITGCTVKPENNKTPIVRAVSGQVLTFYDNTFVDGTETGSVTIKRRVPDLDFICESNYRLWGTMGNTIYGSKYGDPLNFFCYDGLTGDSYFIDVGTDGDFTGCMPYSSHICFFKENTLHKLYGSKPANFQIVTAQVYGVQAGCEKSLCIVNEQLLYKGVGGIYSYSGGVPELISPQFGTRRFSDAVAACDGERYYVSMRSGEKWGMWVYDVLRGIWLQEDDTQALGMVFSDGSIYFVEEDGWLYKIDRNADHDSVEWSATFCPFHETMDERKGYSRFNLRVDLEDGAYFHVEVKTDNDTQWRKVYTTHNARAKTVSVPIIPTRCDSIQIRLSGKGGCIIKAFVREFVVGSDV